MLRPYGPCAASRAARREPRVRGGVDGARGAVDGGGRDGGVRAVRGAVDGGGRDGGGRDGAGLPAAACAASSDIAALPASPTASRSRTMPQPTAWC